MIVEALGLRGIEGALCGMRAFDRERNPRGQSTARGGHCDHVGHKPLRRQIFDDLSRPVVPCPAITSGSSYGGTRAAVFAGLRSSRAR